MIINILEKKYNFNKTSYCKEKNLDIEKIKNGSVSLNINIVNDLIDHTIKKEKNYKLIFDLSKLAKPSDLGILGYLVLNSKTVASSLNTLCTYYILIGKSIKPVLIETDDYYKLSIYSNTEDKGLIHLEKYKTLIHLFAIINLIEDLSKKSIRPIYINLLQDKTFVSNEKNILNDIKINFAEDENAMYFDKNINKINIESSQNKDFEYYKKLAEKHLDINLNNETLYTKVSALILASFSELDVSLNSIYNKVEMSPRVLQKKLKQENTSFSKILEEVRKKLCIYYLKKGLDIQTIAIYLSYNEVNSLFRSFKKWYKITPKEWLLKNKSQV